MPNQVAAPPNPFTAEAVEEPYGVHEDRKSVVNVS